MQRRVLAPTSVSHVVVLLDSSIVNVALNRIPVALGTYIARLQWTMDAHGLAFVSPLLTAGTPGDRWGRETSISAGMMNRSDPQDH